MNVWRERNKDAAPEDEPSAVDIENITKEQDTFITNSVSTLLPRLPENAAYQNVRVTVYQSLTPPPVEEPSMVSQSLLWASNNSGSLIMAGLAMVSLVMLRGMIKSIPIPETNVILSLPAAGGDAEAEARGETGGREGGRARRQPRRGWRERWADHGRSKPAATATQKGNELERGPDRHCPRRPGRGRGHLANLDQQHGVRVDHAEARSERAKGATRI